MSQRSHAQRKTTSDSATSMESVLRARPFAPQSISLSNPTQHSSEFQAQIRSAQGLGHSLKDFSLVPHQPSSVVQPKLTIAAPKDKYEREVDRVTAQVIQRLNAPQPANQAQNLQHNLPLKEEGELQMSQDLLAQAPVTIQEIPTTQLLLQRDIDWLQFQEGLPMCKSIEISYDDFINSFQYERLEDAVISYNQNNSFRTLKGVIDALAEFNEDKIFEFLDPFSGLVSEISSEESLLYLDAQDVQQIGETESSSDIENYRQSIRSISAIPIGDLLNIRIRDVSQKTERKQRAKNDDSETGIAKESAITNFVSEVRLLKEWWKELTPNNRFEKLVEPICNRLRQMGIPPYELSDKGRSTGQFSYEDWTLYVQQDALKSDINPSEFARAANTIYHESRHAEQFFRMARWLAGQQISAKKIAERLNIPKYVAMAAVVKPLTAQGREVEETIAWYKSFYGKEKNFDRVMKNLRLARKEALEDLSEKEQKSVEDLESQKAYRRHPTYQEAHKAYMELPAEADAFSVGYKVEALLDPILQKQIMKAYVALYKVQNQELPFEKEAQIISNCLKGSLSPASIKLALKELRQKILKAYHDIDQLSEEARQWLFSGSDAAETITYYVLSREVDLPFVRLILKNAGIDQDQPKSLEKQVILKREKVASIMSEQREQQVGQEKEKSTIVPKLREKVLKAYEDVRLKAQENPGDLWVKMDWNVIIAQFHLNNEISKEQVGLILSQYPGTHERQKIQTT